MSALLTAQGAGFTREERSIFGLEGFLPYDVHSLEKQCLRAWNQLLKVSSVSLPAEDRRSGASLTTQQPSVILKHAFLASLRDQNQVLFYRLMQDHLKELLGILYTPGESLGRSAGLGSYVSRCRRGRRKLFKPLQASGEFRSCYPVRSPDSTLIPV